MVQTITTEKLQQMYKLLQKFKEKQNQKEQVN